MTKKNTTVKRKHAVEDGHALRGRCCEPRASKPSPRLSPHSSSSPQDPPKSEGTDGSGGTEGMLMVIGIDCTDTGSKVGSVLAGSLDGPAPAAVLRGCTEGVAGAVLAGAGACGAGAGAAPISTTGGGAPGSHSGMSRTKSFLPGHSSSCLMRSWIFS